MTGRSTGGVQSPTDSFFADLATRRHEPLLKSASGSVQFDLVDPHRLVALGLLDGLGELLACERTDGVHLLRPVEPDQADAIVRLDKATFDGMASGRVNAIAATLRGELVPEGDLGLVLLFQRLFPAPEGADGAADLVARRAR